MSTIPSAEVNLTLLHALRHHGYQGRIALTAISARDARRLRDTDADVVVEPYSSATNAVLDHIADHVGEDGTGGRDRA